MRVGTRPEHEKVDGLFGRLDLSRPGDYRCFLQAMAAAYLPVETALDDAGAGAAVRDWKARKRGHLLDQDLTELQITSFEPLDVPRFDSVPAQLGGIYVLEGSRLGGHLLKRSLLPGTPSRFLGASAEPGSWRRLLGVLDARLSSPADIARACDAARSVFRLFESAGQRAMGISFA